MEGTLGKEPYSKAKARMPGATLGKTFSTFSARSGVHTTNFALDTVIQWTKVASEVN